MLALPRTSFSARNRASRPRQRGQTTALLLAGLATLAACSDDSALAPDPSSGPQSAINFQRLFVADTDPTARLFAMHNDSLVQTFTLSAAASYVYSTASGRFIAAQQRTADRVSFFDGGVWTDGAHAHRQAPSRLGFELTDGLPTHASVTGPWISIFMDGNGRAVWLNENDLLAGTPRVAFDVQTGGPHHSGSNTMVVNNAPYFVLAPLNPAGGLPNAVEVRNAAGTVVASTGSCPSMHGNASILNGAVYGCADGLVVVRQGVAGITATKIEPTGAMVGLGLRNAWSSKSGTGLILGQFAALPGQPTRRVLAMIDPVSGAINPLPALPAGVVDHWRAIEPVKGQVALVGNNGSLYVYSAETRQLQYAVANVVPAIAASGASTHQVEVVEDLAAVASPTTGEVVLVNLSTGSVTRRMNVGGTPSRLTIVGAKSAGNYTLVQ